MTDIVREEQEVNVAWVEEARVSAGGVEVREVTEVKAHKGLVDHCKDFGIYTE